VRRQRAPPLTQRVSRTKASLGYPDSIVIRGALAIVCVALSGCSWIAVPGVHTSGEYRDEATARRCNSSSSAPVGDVLVSVVATGLVINGLVVLASDGNTKDPVGPFVGLSAGIFGGLLLVPYSISAIHGYRHVRRCRAELRKPPRP
jgi:hypothetical protein